MLDSSSNNKSVYSAGVFFLFHQELFTLSNVNRRSPCDGINSVHMMQCWLNFWNDRYKCRLLYYLQSKEYADMHIGTNTCAYIIIIIIALLGDKDSQHGSMSVAGSLVISKTNRRLHEGYRSRIGSCKECQVYAAATCPFLLSLQIDSMKTTTWNIFWCQESLSAATVIHLS